MNTLPPSRRVEIRRELADLRSELVQASRRNRDLFTQRRKLIHAVEVLEDLDLPVPSKLTAELRAVTADYEVFVRAVATLKQKVRKRSRWLDRLGF